MPNKNELRLHFKKLRTAISTKEQTQAALHLKNRVLAHPQIQSAQNIGAYLAINNELDLRPTLEALTQQGKQIFVPVLHPFESRFWFAPLDLKQKLQKNKFNILEPIYDLHALIAPWDLDLALVPGLAFDTQGHRLGQGLGYYDRSFAFKKLQDADAKPYLIGCAYDFQKTEILVQECFDIKMNTIITI